MKILKSKPNYQNIILAAISGIMFGFSFPPFEIGILSAFGFIPLFFLLSNVEEYGRSIRYSYLSFFIFNLIAISWVGGFLQAKDPYLMVAGAALLIVHPLVLSIPIVAFTFVRRNLSFKTAIYSYPFLWVSFEYLHSLSEFAFPWLTLGNSLTYDLSLVQFSSLTGVYGLSFWLLWINVIVFVLIVKLMLKEWETKSPKTIACLVLIALLYLIPKISGNVIISNANKETKHTNLKVAVIQPNIDPWEKWNFVTQEEQLDLYLRMSDSVSKETDLIIWAETAIPYYLLMPQYRTYFEKVKDRIDTMNVALLTGFPDIYIYKAEEQPPRSAKKMIYSEERYDSYNSSLLFIPKSDRLQKYSKIRLVPFSERVPYADFLNFLNFLEWGVGIGGWGIGKDTTVFELPLENRSGVKFSNMICYESIYPTFVADFVRKGAQFLTIITNDSWWGDTFGAYQHQRYSVLRAIENRRWIARCANGGISCFIDPYGRVYDETKMYTTAIIEHEIQAREELTPYTKYGDLLAKACLFFSGFLLMAGLGQKFYRFIRKKNYDTN